MAIGKSIRIYLSDGAVSGIRHGEIVNWTGQAIACPRARIPELKEWQESQRPGVYFLVGLDEETGQEAVYIGEAEVVRERLINHVAGKGFWSEAIAFTSKDDNLTKGHVKYLESRLITLALAAGRYKSSNSVSPQLSSLPRADRDAMEEFLDGIRTLLGVLGHKVLEPLVTSPATVKAGVEKNNQSIPVQSATPSSTGVLLLQMNVAGIQGTAIRSDEGLVVLKGSMAALTAQSSLSNGYAATRDRLIQEGALASNGKAYLFSRDCLFSSASQAAAICVGYPINGREAWRTSDGTTLKKLEEKMATSGGSPTAGA